MGKLIWINDKNYCQNKACPNGHQISVAIFKGTGSCSVNCSKAQGIDHAPPRELMMLTEDEQKLVSQFRSSNG